MTARKEMFFSEVCFDLSSPLQEGFVRVQSSAVEDACWRPVGTKISPNEINENNTKVMPPVGLENIFGVITYNSPNKTALNQGVNWGGISPEPTGS